MVEEKVGLDAETMTEDETDMPALTSSGEGDPPEQSVEEATPEAQVSEVVEATVEVTETQAEEAVVEAEASEPQDSRAWYVIHCYSGYENKVKHNLEQRIETMRMQDQIFQVVVPTEDEMEPGT
jgi:transcriptional antiterminator NusG